MTVHMIKLCVGAGSIDDLSDWQRHNRTRRWPTVGRVCAYHTTRQRPKRQQELLAGGSIYWVIKGVVQVRQALIGLEATQNDKGVPACALLLDPELVPVEPQPRRAFQGWRYLDVEDAPADLSALGQGGVDDLPPRLRQELAALCLI